MSIQIRKLIDTDWREWKSVRLEALQLHPEAFASSYAQERELSDDEFKQRLIRNDVFGAFKDCQLIGTAGFFVFRGIKTEHKGCLYGMYLQKKFRATGIAGDLVKAVIQHAQQHVSQLHCSVVTTNISAIRLYEKNGLKIYGTEQNALKIGTEFYDEHLMFTSF